VLLAADKGLASLALRLQRVEILLEPFFRGFACVDGATEDSTSAAGLSPSLDLIPEVSDRFFKPKKRGPDQRVPVISRAMVERQSKDRLCHR
jgi:hypothetical protein